jgi:hypothetical protein
MVVEKQSFKEQLTDAIKDAGMQLIDMAEDLANDADKNLLSRLTIYVRFDPEFCIMQMPTIQVDKEYICKAAIDRMKGASR